MTRDTLLDVAVILNIIAFAFGASMWIYSGSWPFALLAVWHAALLLVTIEAAQ